jgi:C4-dicarboxylate transporter, DctM subunit
MVILPLLQVVARQLDTAIPGAIPIVQHLTLWVCFLGAAIGARKGRLLSLGTGTFLPEGRARATARAYAAAVSLVVLTLLVWGSLQLVEVEREVGTTVGTFVPTWIAQLAIPLGLALIGLRLASQSGGWYARAAILPALILAIWILRDPAALRGFSAVPALVVLLTAGVLGAPIFVLLGGVAAFLMLSEGHTNTTVSILIKTYDLTTSYSLPAIPLFTLAGFLFAEGQTSERLLRVFRAWFGWMPGGTAIVCACLCSFFTVFTGGSGVTILALGGLLFPALLKEGYRDRFSLGLLTASGSLGLLLPPALPLIVYSVVAQQPVEDLFVGGILPGILLTSLIAAWGVREGMVVQARRTPFRLGEAFKAAWDAKWELVTPALVLGSIFSGYATPIESAALTAFYALVVQMFVRRDISFKTDLRRVSAECVATVGGVLIILSMAVGLTHYLVGAQVPAHLLAWTESHIHSPAAFLLGLNLFLLIVGCLMDIFSATAVVVPLIVPLGAAYGVHPVHLAIIFIANLELGYLTPPVGMNLFLSAYRFGRPMLEVARATLPMLAILGIGVLLITYVPWMTLGLLQLMGRI